ncbi:MAG TPA: BMP family ABC transporter substrate-binding protein [Actinomycetota bacterium]|nr:BMP family ABC transporter substrate-binding protein [Actinomycetota bacterium]
MVGRRSLIVRVGFVLTALALVATACDGGTKSTQGQAGGGESKPCLKEAFVFVLPMSIPGWTGAAADSIPLLKQKYPCVETRAFENVSEGTDAERVFSDLAQQGFDVIYGHTFGYMDTMAKVAPRYPDVIFMNGSGYKTAENYSNYNFAGYEGTYLAGIAAASVTKSKKLGWVGSFPTHDVLWDLNAFTLGARSVDPGITVQVVWAADWASPVKDKQAADSLIAAGVDVIGQSSGSPSVGEEAEKAHVFWVPTEDRKQAAWGPDYALVTRHNNWAAAFESVTKAVLDDTWTNTPYFGSLKDGFIQMTDYNEAVPQATLDLIDKTKQQIIDGTLQIWKGPIEDNTGKMAVPDGSVFNEGDLAQAQFLVEGVIGTIPKG